MSKARKTHEQLEIGWRTHGGKRKGAGRPPKGVRAAERHKARPVHDRHHPVHVTIRVVADVSNLRRRAVYLHLRESTIITAKRVDFRIVHISIQSNHIHLIVEAEHGDALSKGVQGFSISAARRINAAISERTGVRRTGKIIADRFHARALTSPRAVRHAISYILNNWRHHKADRGHLERTWKVDPFSSGALFFGWKELEGSPVLWPLRATYHPLVVFRPRTWLLAKGWQLHYPLISVCEVPGR